MKPAHADSLPDPISKKNPSQKKRTGGVAKGKGLEFKSQYHKKRHTNKGLVSVSPDFKPQ
jgi:hypothetical protein